MGYDNAYTVDNEGYAITLDYGYGDGLLTRDDVLYMLEGRICKQSRRCVCMDSMILYSKDKVDKDTRFYFVNEILSLNYYRDVYGYRACELSTRINRRI